MSDSILVRVTLDSYDMASTGRQTQVYVQIPEVARVSWLLPGDRFHGLVDRAWPEVLDVTHDFVTYGGAASNSSTAAAWKAVMEWLRNDANRDEMQAAYEEDQARRHPVARKLRDRIAELERERNAFRDQRNNVFATNEELRAKFEAQMARANTLDRLLRTAQDRLAEYERPGAEAAALELPETALEHVQAILLAHFGELPRPDMAVGLLLTNLRAEWEAEGRARIADLEAAREQLVRWHGEDDKTIKTLVARVDQYRARVAELEALVEQATEFRLWEPGYGLYVRRAPGATGFAVMEARRTDKGRRVWTTAGWQYSALLPDAELFCWPDAQTAVAEARRIMPGAEVREVAEDVTPQVQKLRALLAGQREQAAANAPDEWCTGCNTDHDPDECGYRPKTGGGN